MTRIGPEPKPFLFGKLAPDITAGIVYLISWVFTIRELLRAFGPQTEVVEGSTIVLTVAMFVWGGLSVRSWKTRPLAAILMLSQAGVQVLALALRVFNGVFAQMDRIGA